MKRSRELCFRGRTGGDEVMGASSGRSFRCSGLAFAFSAGRCDFAGLHELANVSAMVSHHDNLVDAIGRPTIVEIYSRLRASRALLLRTRPALRCREESLVVVVLACA